MSAPDVLDLHGVAAELGMSYDHVRKCWRDWADPRHPDFRAFPPPFIGASRGRRTCAKWRRTAIAEWKLARERALGPGRAAPPPPSLEGAADFAATRHAPRLQRERAQLLSLMERA